MYLLVFHAYNNKMHCSRNKIPSKNLVSQLCAEGFNSGVKVLSIQNSTIVVIPTPSNIGDQCYKIS
jgi:hypothetical protein